MGILTIFFFVISGYMVSLLSASSSISFVNVSHFIISQLTICFQVNVFKHTNSFFCVINSVILTSCITFLIFLSEFSPQGFLFTKIVIISLKFFIRLLSNLCFH